jgi:uncharacterized protein YecE (DUF72 family)
LFSFYQTWFNTVEINSSFYHMPKRTTCESWNNKTPDDFKFVLKAPRGITHYCKLSNNCYSIVCDFIRATEPLIDKIACILWQFPPSFRMNSQTVDRLGYFCEQIQPWFPYSAFEFRHDSWLDERIVNALIDYDFEYVRSDHRNMNSLFFPRPKSKFSYFRMHGPKGNYRGSYSDVTLDRIAAEMRETEFSLAYFDNDFDVGAPYDAQKLIGRLSSEVRPTSLMSASNDYWGGP